MEFFVENWIWFLVAGIVILMTLIGYLAEKTDFGRKDIPKKEKKNEKIQKIEEQPEKRIEENKPEVQMSLATDTILESIDEEKNENIEQKPEEKISDNEELEDLKAPFGNITFDTNDTNIKKESEDIENVQEIEKTTEEEVKLPDLDNILHQEAQENIEDEDDVWKF